MEASPPSLPLMVRAGRREHHVLDPGLLQSFVDGDGAGMETFLRRARAIKPCDEIIGHLFNLKLNAHFHLLLILHLKSLKGVFVACNLFAIPDGAQG